MLATVLIEQFEQVTVNRDVDLDLLLFLWERGPAALPWKHYIDKWLTHSATTAM